MHNNSLVSLEESGQGCQAHEVFYCSAPSSFSASGKVDFPCRILKRYCSGSYKCRYLGGRLVYELVSYDGSLCRGCPWANFPEVPPLLVIHSIKSQEFQRYKVNRFLVRAFRGVACGLAKGYRFRWFVLTESNEAIKLGLSFGREFNRFLVWLRYWCPDFQYIVVEHRQGDKQRRNWHVLSYGSDKLPVLRIRSYWLKHFKSTVTGMAEVRDIRKSVYYLVRYVGDKEKFVRSWCSQGWVFRGWLGISKAHRKIFGDYVCSEDLKALSLMSPCVRSYSLMWLLNSGYLSEADLKDKQAIVACGGDDGTGLR